jgi:hypothetical protein
MKRFLFVVLLFGAAWPAAAQHGLVSGGEYDPSVPTPRSVLGYEVGERFTPHHLLVRYLERLVAASPRIRLDTVARSFEGREVLMAIVTSEANQRRLDAIRADAARLGDPRGVSASELGSIAQRTPAIAWLGYTVHGPEASGVEAAIALLYQLAAGRDAETRMVLDSTVVLIDPVQNPDGHERHAQDVMRMRGALAVSPHPDARVHTGTWPGPRTSHYYFDLNRDWYALSHPETRGRVSAMLQWYPHVAVDVHEMGSNSSYFFPPTMDPINKLVQPVILQWWDTYADAIIEAFDQHGWSFFRREGYDEFYPGYGSSWPTYMGAVGMTFEQASSRGGAIRRSDGTILTLRDAARHHYTASWATLTTTARRARERVRDYLAYRQSAIADGSRGPMRAVVLERDAQGRADSLAARLLANGIEVRAMLDPGELRDPTEFGGRRSSSARIARSAWVVDFAQPQGRLARALLEPDAPLDSAFIAEELDRRRTGQSERFYDVTAWSLPFTFRTRAWWTGSSVPTAGTVILTDSLWRRLFTTDSRRFTRGRYGYAFAPGSESSIRLLAALLADSVRVWYAPRAFRAGDHDFPDGAFVVRAAANDTTVHALVGRHAAAFGARVAPLASAAADAGTDLGSNSVFPIRAPRVALLSGPPVSGNSFGYTWYALDHRIGYPSTAIDADAVGRGALGDFDVLVIPSVSAAGLARALGDSGKDRIAAWVRNGGVLVTLDAASGWLASERSGISRLRLREDSARTDSAGTPTGAPLPADVPGAIVRAIGDTLSPLMAGITEREIPVLVFSDRIFTVPKDFQPGEVVLRYADEMRLRLSGYLWPEVPRRLAGTPYLWTERVGAGRVIAFAGDPNFRDLWRGLLPLFANALFLGRF